jgi:hypothetical protein
MFNMTTITLEGYVTLRTLLKEMKDQGVFLEKWEQLTVILLQKVFIEHSVVAFLCTWGMEQIDNGRKIAFSGDVESQNYLARMDLFKHLAVNYSESFRRHKAVGRFSPIQLVNDVNSTLAASNAICNL